MNPLIQAINQLSANSSYEIWKSNTLRHYLLTGEQEDLSILRDKLRYVSFPEEIIKLVGLPQAPEDPAMRLLKACVEAHNDYALRAWLQNSYSKNNASFDQFEQRSRILLDLGLKSEDLAIMTARFVRPLTRDGQLTSAGKFLRRLSLPELLAVLSSPRTSINESETEALALFLAENSPSLLKEALALPDQHEFLDDPGPFWKALLKHSLKDFGPLAANLLERLSSVIQVQVGGLLAKHDFRTYGAIVEKQMRRLLSDDNCAAVIGVKHQAALWLLSYAPRNSDAEWRQYLQCPLSVDQLQREITQTMKIEFLQKAANKLGKDSRHLLDFCCEIDQAEVQYEALRLWMKFHERADREKIAARLHQALSGKDSGVVARLVILAAEWDASVLESDLWSLLTHPARPVRESSVSALSRWLGRLPRETAQALLRKRLAGEKKKRIIQVIQNLLASLATESTRNAGNEAVSLPKLSPVPDHLPLGAETKRGWRECFQQINGAIKRLQAAPSAPNHLSGVKPISADLVEKAFAGLAEGEPKPILAGLLHAGGEPSVRDPLITFWRCPELQLIHFVRFMVQVGVFETRAKQDAPVFAHGFWFERLFPVYRQCHPDTGLRELAAAFTDAGLDPRRIGRGWLNPPYGGSALLGMPKAQVWPYWAEHLDLLEEAITPATEEFSAIYLQRRARVHAFKALACFPKPPIRLMPLLWNLALGPKSERSQAQRCLDGTADKLDRLMAGLASGSAETRLAAAEWLGRLGNRRATESLLAALKREKNETAKGALMSALEQLSVPVEQFLDRANLLKEAENGLAKGLPDALKWFPFDQLPLLHWLDTGKKVEPEIIRWWLVQSFKLKNPAPGPLLRRYCASFNPAEREVMGQFILVAWIMEDTAPLPGTEAGKQALCKAPFLGHYAQFQVQQAQLNSSGQPPSPSLTGKQYYAQMLPTALEQPKGSAIASKGILAVAGACVGSAAVPVINQYLKEWYGQRAAQCKALLQMLAWSEHPTAIQLLLAVGSRFRTKSIQEAAHRLAQAVAERKGWTVDELADRTIPEAGLDEHGVLTMDYGSRLFTAKLNEDLEFTLADGSGKSIPSLPDPRKDDDEAKAGEAKKRFQAARKELKSVVAMQRDRLYEAICTQRTWALGDWDLCLNQHPIAKHLCQRLIWAVVQDDKAVCLFRPLADGSLTNANDAPVELAATDRIRVAHECLVTPAESQTWREHLKDYSIEALFPQFGRPQYRLSEAQRCDTEIVDFQGHLLEAFKLRRRANQLGYVRGQAQEGGWFFEYHKRFPVLGLAAVVEFTGNGLPEENRTVALTILRFDRVVPEDGGSVGAAQIMLSEVPPVLLSECWNDLRTMAADGPGFDSDWEKKTQT